MKLKLIQLLIWLLCKEFDDIKLTPKQRMIAYKDAYLVENLELLIRKQIKQAIYQIALKGKDNNEIWFNRGFIHAYQTFLHSTKRNHELFVKQQTNEKGESRRIQKGYSA